MKKILTLMAGIVFISTFVYAQQTADLVGDWKDSGATIVSLKSDQSYSVDFYGTIIQTGTWSANLNDKTIKLTPKNAQEAGASKPKEAKTYDLDLGNQWKMMRHGTVYYTKE